MIYKTFFQKNKLLFLVILFFCLFIFFPLRNNFFAIAATAENRFKNDHIEVSLISERNSIAPGESIELGFHFKLVKNWYLFWQNPGDLGVAPTLEWKLPVDFQASEWIWPTPKKKKNEQEKASFIYEKEILFPVKITAPSTISEGENYSFLARLNWLICKKECFKENAELNITLPVKTDSMPTKYSLLFKKAKTFLPNELQEWKGSLAQEKEDSLVIDLTFPSNVDPSLYFIEVFPFESGLFEAGSAQVLSQTAGKASFAFFKTPKAPKNISTFTGLAVVHRHKDGQPISGIAFEAQPPSVIEGGKSASNPFLFWTSLLGAFLGGLLLNLMPCVFPILAIKIVGIAKQLTLSRKQAKIEGFAFALGVLISFWALGGLLIMLRNGGAKIGWGFQLQEPIFVMSMILLFFLASLYFIGLFEIGYGIQSFIGRIPVKTTGIGGSFFSGILATTVSTPCTAPFMGAAMGVALIVPGFQSMLIFTAIGLGMSLPYVFITYYVPKSSWLPKPGQWMEKLKEFMAFPMFATCLWLLWVFGKQKGLDALIIALFGLLAIGLAGWFLSLVKKSSWKKGIFSALIGLAGGLSLLYQSIQQPYSAGINELGSSSGAQLQNGLEWEAWSKKRQDELVEQGRTVYVDFTAAWCITCQLNKKIVFGSEEVRKKFKEYHVALLKADWTNQDPNITSALESFGRSGVPLNIVYGPTPRHEPSILPSALTPGIVLEALEKHVKK